jgi:hypothetical protein
VTHDAVKVALVHVLQQLAGLLRVADVLKRLGCVLAYVVSVWSVESRDHADEGRGPIGVGR